jgi:hypothetical protein
VSLIPERDARTSPLDHDAVIVRVPLEPRACVHRPGRGSSARGFGSLVGGLVYGARPRCRPLARVHLLIALGLPLTLEPLAARRRRSRSRCSCCRRER